jgi:hypothetical protein
MPEAEKKKTIAEFNFAKGILVATFSGIMSACFAFGLAAGKPIEDLTYCSSIVHSAAKAGRTITTPAAVKAEESATVVASLQGLGFFNDRSPSQSDKDLVSVIEALEAPVMLDAQIAHLNAQLAEADASQKAEAQKKLAESQADLTAATKAFPGKIAALKQASGPLVERLRRYQASLEGLRGKTAELNTIAGLKDLTRKEVAVAAIESGADFLSFHRKHQLWTGLPVLIVVLLGGFTTNFVWCVLLNIRNQTGYQYFSPTLRQEPPQREDETIIETAIDAPSEEVVTHAPGGQVSCGDHRVPMLSNYFFSALAGTTWYFQFFFYTMGATQMGKYDFASWTLHMASIIIFSTLWGVALHEWKGSSKRTHALIALGLAVLVLSTIIVGYGNYLKALPAAP